MGNSYNKLKIPIVLSNIYYNSRFYIFSKNQRLFFKKFNHKYKLFYSIFIVKSYSTSIIRVFKVFNLFLSNSFFYINRVVLTISNKLGLHQFCRRYLSLSSYYRVIKKVSFKSSDIVNYFIYISSFLLYLVLFFYRAYYNIAILTSLSLIL